MNHDQIKQYNIDHNVEIANDFSQQREEEAQATACLYHMLATLPQPYTNPQVIEFVRAYDAANGARTYEYYQGPTTSPSVCTTTLSQVLLDSLTFDSSLEEIAADLDKLVDMGFCYVSITPRNA